MGINKSYNYIGKDENEPAFYYHSDHLGSASYVTNSDGKVTQTLNYLPYGEDWVDLQNFSEMPKENNLGVYQFNGKEKDDETGYNYYGARYYDSEKLGWLSVDPMSDKYPNLSPYVYCANNPVKLIDPDGRDSEISIEDNTMTVRADIYMKKSDNEYMKKIKEGMDMWNNTSFKYIKDGKSYNIKFLVNVITSDKYGNDFETDDDVFNAYQGAHNKYSNFLQFGETIKDENGVSANGQVEGSKTITLNKDMYTSRTVGHEVGHILGLGEWTNGLMESEGEHTDITKGMIKGLMYNAGIMNEPSFKWGDYQQETSSLFNKGKINIGLFPDEKRNGKIKY